jgi:hypothetical protein
MKTFGEFNHERTVAESFLRPAPGHPAVSLSNRQAYAVELKKADDQ